MMANRGFLVMGVVLVGIGLAAWLAKEPRAGSGFSADAAIVSSHESGATEGDRGVALGQGSGDLREAVHASPSPVGPAVEDLSAAEGPLSSEPPGTDAVPFGDRRPFLTAHEYAADRAFNKSGRFVAEADLARLDECLQEANRTLADLRRERLDAAEAWAKEKINFGDYRVARPGETAITPAHAGITVAISDRELTRIVTIKAGEFADVDLANLKLQEHCEATYANIHKALNGN